MKSSIRLAVALAATSWMTLAGCAQNVGDIDRTQANRIDVSVLNDGKPWWFTQSTIGVPPQSGLTFVGDNQETPMVERIVWDVQENWLVAYRNYEFLVGSQIPYSQVENNNVAGNGTAASRTAYFGTPVAAYPILSHFDVQREYNAQTGEQTNVISENTTDRPWYERQYVRVDWANNAFGGFQFMYMTTVGQANSSILTSPLSYYVDQSDPTNADHSEITENYVGIVNKVSYKAEVDPYLSSYYGQTIYTCANGALEGIDDCGPGEVKIRLSFMKMPDTHDFVPREFNDKDELMFGSWQAQRLQYDQQRGIVEPLLAENQYSVMHHIWQADHLAKDPAGNPCDIHDMTNTACIAPLNQRTPKPIIYYVSPGWPSIDDPRHYPMWIHEALISDDYNNDMRGVVAGALRGGPNSVEKWAAANGVPLATNTDKIDYSQPDTSYSRYSGAIGLDYLAYPPQTNPDQPGAEDLTNYAYRGTRPAATWILQSDSNTICSFSQISQGLCSKCDPTKGYCMGIDHVPYSVVPRMVTFCHNPVQPRKVTWNGVAYDKSDPNNSASYEFQYPGDPDMCDSRTDAERTANPLSPQLGDLRYNMHAYVPQPDQSSPGGIGLPAADPVTGEIVSAHAYVYGRAVESYATLGADMVSVLNGWTSYSDLINGNIVNDYITSIDQNPNVVFQPTKIQSAMLSPGSQARLASLRARVGATYDKGGHALAVSGGTAIQDFGVSNYNALLPLLTKLNPAQPNNEFLNDFAPSYGNAQFGGSNAPLPSNVVNQTSMAAFVAPPALNNFNGAYEASRRVLVERHALMDEEIEPTALRLAKYYKDKFAANDPCVGRVSDGTASADYRTCIWEEARKEILGNMWRSYSDHEVGHTFGQYHNFAGSTDALNYFDPYWNLRQNNVVTNIGSCAAGDTTCNEMTTALGPNLPGKTALAPEWLQAPSYSDLQSGLREYQYTSIMDYNSKFNSDFQGLGKYDHAEHMFQYGRMVEVFDPVVMSKVPPNADSVNHAHQVDDQVLQPFNRHYTMYPWILTDGATGSLSAAQTPLPEAIQKMIHARKWVRYDDLNGSTPDLPAGLQDADVQARDGFPSVAALVGSGSAAAPGATMVPYRFCSDYWNEGEPYCLWFDEGADGFEQANGFIKQYKYNYFFSNFKRQSVEYHLYDNVMDEYSRLWDRNFRLLARIGQHYFNDELIFRGNERCSQDAANNPHYIALGCGMDRTAAVILIDDFLTKLMQTPNPDTLLYDPTTGVMCGAATCAQDGYSKAVAIGPSASPVTLQPGDSAKADISLYSYNQYGMTFNIKPTVSGIWLDKLLAAQTLGDYSTNFIGQLNNQPLNYLISIHDLFPNDIQRAIGALVLNDPKFWPLTAVYNANPQDPAHPPVTVYRNSAALQNASPNAVGVVINTWCPAGDPQCNAVVPPLPPAAPNPNGYAPSYETPPPGYGIVTYPAPSGVASILPPLAPGQFPPVPQDSSPVYFEKLFALAIGAIYYTNANDTQQFIQSIKIAIKGNGYDATAPQALECNGSTAGVLKPTQATCETGDTCSATTSTCTVGNTPESCTVGSFCSDHTTPCQAIACSDGSSCALRGWGCLGLFGEAARAGGGLTGVCQYPGNTTDPTGQSFGYANCDGDMYAEYQDPQKGNVNYAVRYLNNTADFGQALPDPYGQYSPGYEVIRLAQKQAASGTTQLGASQFIDIFRQYYYYWSNSYQPGSIFGNY